MNLFQNEVTNKGKTKIKTKISRKIRMDTIQMMKMETNQQITITWMPVKHVWVLSGKLFRFLNLFLKMIKTFITFCYWFLLTIRCFTLKKVLTFSIRFSLKQKTWNKNTIFTLVLSYSEFCQWLRTTSITWKCKILVTQIPCIKC